MLSRNVTPLVQCVVCHSDHVSRAEQRLCLLRRTNFLPAKQLDEFIAVSRWLAAEYALGLGVPLKHIPQYMPLRKMSAKTVQTHTTTEFNSFVRM
jgi:hypothetical protein